MPPDVCWWGVGHPGWRSGAIRRANQTFERSAQPGSDYLALAPERRWRSRRKRPRPGLAGASGLRGWNVAPGSRCVRNRQADRGPHYAVDHHHGAGVTVRTLPQRPPGQRLEPLAVVTGRFGRCGWRHPEQLPAALEFSRPGTVAEEAVGADAVKPVRQHMNEEAADELATIQRHRLLAIACLGVPPRQWALAVAHEQQPVVDV